MGGKSLFGANTARPLHMAALLIVLLLAAPAGAHEPGSASLVVPLQYDATLAEANFPNPAVQLTVNGRTAWFLFDTGAGVHTLADWFADAAGLQIDDDLADTVQGVDATGQSLRFRAVRDVVGRVSKDGTLTLPLAAVAGFPASFERAGIGGLINPQLLAGDAQSAALDLRVPELRIEPFDVAVRRLHAEPLAGEVFRTCSAEQTAVPNLLVALAVAGQGSTGWLELDTGAAVTVLAQDSGLLTGVKTESGGETTGITGKPQTYMRARGLEALFAAHRAIVDAKVVEKTGTQCGVDGRLGLDAMKRCAFVIAADQLAVTCRSRSVDGAE